jgi:hypothetical protein
MVKLKKYSFIFLGVLLLYGCSTPTIIEKPYPVYIPGVHDTILLAQDTVYVPSDSNAYWEGNVEDSLKNVIGWLKVYYNKRIAELKLNPKVDTIKVPIEIPVERDKVVQIISGFLPWWGEAILIAIGILLLSFINKKNNLLDLIKGIKWK